MNALDAAIKSLEIKVERAANSGKTSILTHVGYINKENIDYIVCYFKSKGFHSYRIKDTFDVYDDSIAIEW